MDPRSKRNYGLDLLKCICMFCVIMYHYADHIPIFLLDEIRFSPNWFIMISARIFGVICNCTFVLCTGYFQCKKQVKVSRIVKLYMEVWFYSVVCCIAANLLFGKRFFINMEIARLPLLNNEYWFFSSYIILLILTPFINSLIDHISRQWHLKLIGVLMLLYSVIPQLFPTFFLRDSNHAMTFVLLYLIGAYIRIYDIKPKVKPIYIALISTAAEIASIVILSVMENTDPFRMVWPLNTILCIITSVSWFLVFKDMKVKPSKLLTTVSASLFGVYLIHIGRLRPWVYGRVFNYENTIATPLLILEIIGCAVVIFPVCILMDKVRILLLEKPLMTWIDQRKFIKRIDSFFTEDKTE